MRRVIRIHRLVGGYLSNQKLVILLIFGFLDNWLALNENTWSDNYIVTARVNRHDEQITRLPWGKRNSNRILLYFAIPSKPTVKKDL